MHKVSDERLECLSCGRRFPRASKQRPKYCSNKCRQQAYRDRGKATSEPLAEFRLERRWARAANKRPIMPNGWAASSTNPQTWSTFDQVKDGVGNGFGVFLGNGLGCYDLDKCVQGNRIEPWVREFVKAIPEKVLFIERSMSGTGLHIFFQSDSEERGSAKGGVERYTWARFIRVTFDKFSI